MGAIISLIPYLWNHFFGSKDEIKDKYRKSHIKCRNNDPDNERFSYQSNIDSKKGEVIYVRISIFLMQ